MDVHLTSDDEINVFEKRCLLDFSGVVVGRGGKPRLSDTMSVLQDDCALHVPAVGPNSPGPSSNQHSVSCVKRFSVNSGRRACIRSSANFNNSSACIFSSFAASVDNKVNFADLISESGS